MFISLIEFDYINALLLIPSVILQIFSYPRTDFKFYSNPNYLILVFLSTRPFHKCTLNFQRIISILCHLITKHVHNFQHHHLCRIKCFFLFCFSYLFVSCGKFCVYVLCTLIAWHRSTLPRVHTSNRWAQLKQCPKWNAVSFSDWNATYWHSISYNN